MADDLEDFLEFMDRAAYEVNEIHIRIPKRYFRDRTNPFEYFSEDAFFKRYKFSKEEIMYFILPIIEEDLEKHNNRGLPVQPVLQLLMAIRFYATSSYQAVIGDLNDFAQSTLCLCIRRVSLVLAGNMHNYVHFPRTIEGQRQNIKMFYAIAGFPHIAACIDGSLIKIASPGKAIAEIFRSRKGFLALNVMNVVDRRGEILFLDVKHPGSVHDQTCFDRSALKTMFIENRITGLLLGDNGYGCQPYLLTPVLNPLNQAEHNYNKRHIKTRNIIEKAFGRWKRKFSCLKRCLLNKLDNSIVIICATAVLWNLHIHLHDPIIDFQHDELNEDVHYLDDNAPRNINGLDYRLNFIMLHFFQQ